MSDRKYEVNGGMFKRAASPSGPSPDHHMCYAHPPAWCRCGVVNCHPELAGESGPSPAAGLDPDLVEQAFKNLGLWGDYPEWTKTRREYAEKFAAEYDRLSRSGGAGDGGDRP